MALCVVVETTGLNAGYLKQSSTPVSSCADYVMMSATEYQELPTLIDVFTFPVAEDLQQMWMTGFSLPVIAYLTAWAYACVINWFDRNQ